MDFRLVLTKIITLLYRESEIKVSDSKELITKLLELVIVPEGGMVISREPYIINSLRNTAYEMLNAPDTEQESGTLLQQLKVNCDSDEELYSVFVEEFSRALSEDSIKKSIVSLRRYLQGQLRLQQLADLFSKASAQFRFNPNKVDVNSYIAKTIQTLEGLQVPTDNNDPAIIAEIDLDDEDAVTSTFQLAQDQDSGEGLMRLGWVGLNEMAQGGIRRGSTTIINALQHKYKTGINLTMFKDMAIFNQPYLFKPNKKPMLLRISFEDEIENNLQFLYQVLRYEETREYVSIKSITARDMAKYVRSRMQVNGFTVKMLRVNPSDWTYRHICNMILDYESKGYEIHALILDYLAHIPTTGCNTNGPTGTDMRDLFRRMRNFTAARKIALITPHQLNPEAKRLIRGGTPEYEFVKEVAEKGYTSGSSQIDQEVDLELYIHLFKHNKRTWFSIMRGKHRLPTTLDDDKKYILYQFPRGMPILPDINDEKPSHFTKLPASTDNDDSDMFKF